MPYLLSSDADAQYNSSTRNFNYKCKVFEI